MAVRLHAIQFKKGQTVRRLRGSNHDRALTRTHDANDLRAIISDYRGPATNELTRSEVLSSLADHQRIIEQSMVNCPVLPVKFGTILRSTREVEYVLNRSHRLLATALSRIGNAVEIEVAATWELEETFANISRLPQIAAWTAMVRNQPVDETLTTRIKIGQFVKDTLDRWREEHLRRAMSCIDGLFLDAQPNVILSDELVFNVAFLIDRSNVERFYARIHRYDKETEEQLNFRCIGPLPPYSFATVEIIRPCAKEIGGAGRLLGLGDRASEEEINGRYRDLAMDCHPDRHPGDPEAPTRFAALAEAHRLLVAYAQDVRAGDESIQGDHRIELAESTVETVLLAKIRKTSLPTIEYRESSNEFSAIAV